MSNLKVAKKVLVVDDFPAIRELLARYLDRSGFATCLASDGREALEAFQREQPDLLIADVRMPNMSGFELTRQVRTISDIPIVMMTVESGYIRGDREAAFDAGADAFLMKPVNLADLLGEIKALLARTEPHGGCKEMGQISRSDDQLRQ